MKRTNFLFVVFCILILLPDVKSQDIRQAKNSLFIELFGNGGLYSINYERGLTSKIYGRVGFGGWTTTLMGSETKMTTIPVLITYLTGHKSTHFEIGAGLLFGNQIDYNGSRPVFDFTSFLGFRYQKPGKGFLFRVGLTPFVSLNTTNYPDKVMLSAGISFGYHF